jgi:serine/threonine protein kinase
VVLKQVRSFVARDAELRRTFVDEGRLGEQLCHPNVVATHGVLEEGDELSIVMEYLDGQSYARARERLHGLHAHGQLGFNLFVLAEVCAGLHYAHTLCAADGTPLGIVHRDVSPQNVVVSYDGRVKLVDFGRALHAVRVVEPSVPFKGKLAYAAPEQVALGAVDPRTDLFALGVMLWEALAGRSLWQGMDNAEIHARLLRKAWPSLREAAPQADRALVALCEAAMHERPEGRPATARQFRACLEDAAHRLGVSTSESALGELLSGAFTDERDELRAQLMEYFARGTHESGDYERIFGP